MATYAGRYDEPLLKLQAGNRLAINADATVQVYESDGSTAATLYTGRTKATTASNPVTVDSAGNLEFFADPGTYVLSILEGGSEAARNTVTVPADPSEMAAFVEDNIVVRSPTSTKVNAALASLVNGGTVTVAEGMEVDAALVIPSNVELRIAPGVALTRATGYLGNIITNDAAANPLVATTGSMTSGSATLTVADSVFDASHVGKSLYVKGARYHATIVSVTNATTVELSGNATATVSGAAVRVYGRDENIRLTFGPGALVAGGDNAAATGVNLPHIRFRGVDGVQTENVRVTSTGGKYALHFYACTNFVARNTWFEVSSDGIHVSGISSHGRIDGVFGTTSDDSVALTSTEYENYMDADVGDMNDIVIERVYTTNDVIGSGVGTGNAVKVLPGSADGTGHTVSDITVRHVEANTTTVLSNAVFLGGDTADPLTVGGTLKDVTVEDAVNNGTADSVCLVKQTTFRDIVLRRIGFPATSAGRAVFISNAATIETLTIADCDWAPNIANVYPVKLDPTLSACTIDTLRFVNCRLKLPTKTGGLIHTGTTGHTIRRIFYSGYRCDMAVWSLGAFYHTAAQTTLHLSDVSIASSTDAGMFYMASASVSILIAEAGLTTSTAPVAALTTTGGTLRSRTLGFPVDVDLLSRTNNDMAYNTDAALSCGEGPVICSGGLWTHLATGATY